jgi:hypothetical protein
MSYIGSTPTTQNFIAGTDSFNGNGSATNFTLSRFVNSTNDIQVVVNNVVQYPPNYSVSGNTLTISPAPSAGTNNVYVRYLSTTLQSIAPSQGIAIQFGTGSVGLPSISFIGDTNTGIYSPAADTLAFVEGGTEAMRINSSANVGIGTTSPSSGAIVRFIQVDNATSAGVVFNAARKYSIYSSASSTLVFYDETGAAVRAAIDSSGNFQFNSGYGSVATAFGCRAWVNFNGSGTVAIRASGNVTSITDNNVGDYTVNFTTAMPDANYSCVGFSEPGAGAGNKGPYQTTSTASGARVNVYNSAGSLVDSALVNVAIFR